MLKHILTVFILSLGLSAPLSAAGPYYMAQSSDGGSDSNSGDIAHPFLSMTKCYSVMVAGDTCYIRGGSFPGIRNNVTGNSGTSFSNPITFSGYPGESATITDDGTGQNVLGIDGNEQYIVFKNIKVDGQGVSLFLASTAINRKWENIEFTGSVHSGIQGSCVGCQILNNHFHLLGTDSNQDHAIYLGGAGCNTHDNLVMGNEIDHIPHGYGTQIYGDGCTDINDNLVDGNYYHEIDLTDGGGAGGVVITSGQRNFAINNIVANSDGVAYQLGAGAGCIDCGVLNNVAYNNQVDGVLVFGSGEVRNRVQNNILYMNGASITNNGPASMIISNNFTSDPNFTNAASGDFTLQPVSGAIGFGTNLTGLSLIPAAWSFDRLGNARPATGTVDDGPYVFGSSPPPPSFCDGTQSPILQCFHHGNSGDDTTIVSGSLPVATTVDDYLIVGLAVCGDASCSTTSSRTVSSLTDGTNTYTRCAQSAHNIAIQQEIWYAKVLSSGNPSLTASYGGSTISYGQIFVTEVSGLRSSSPCEVSGSATGTGTTISVTTSGSITKSGEFIYSIANSDDTTFTANSPFNDLQSKPNNGDAFHVGSGSATETATWAQPDSVAWSAVIAAFLPNGTASLTTVSPSNGVQGSTLDLNLTGLDTAWVNGTSVCSLSGSGITINSTTVSSATSAVCNITLSGSATVSARDVTMTTDSDVETATAAFTVIQAGIFNGRSRARIRVR